MEKSKEKKVDEIHQPRTIPTWVQELVQQLNGTEPCFIMTKNLTKTDLDANQNRLLINTGYVKAHLIPFLSDEEKAAASLLDYERKRKKPVDSGGGVEEQPEGEAAKEEEKKKKAGRKHRGLRVPVYVGANKWKAHVLLASWDSSNGTVLKGGEYSRYLARWSGLNKGDKVELWGFREGEMRRPCFALHRNESS
ncbi:putative B3 domain-containing protein [Cocos nucifera]|uniref:Putative B3 domain-containing protein n=1 Tax=Cocos nucifera TaxID=13894 RepID=A0A8K0I461_COCNU|nr:putative B3 domain-containing protein [Cocos nucifera]